MYYKTLSVLALSAAALAAPQENSWDSKMQEAAGEVSPEQVSAAAGVFTDPTSLAQAAMIPTSAAESIVAAIPSGYIQSLASNPSAFESVANDLASGKYPDWYSSEVPVSIQTQVAASASAFSSELPTGSSSGSSSGSASASASATPSDSASASASESASASGSESASASGSATDNGAAAPTAMAMGVAGAAGVLGLALVL